MPVNILPFYSFYYYLFIWSQLLWLEDDTYLCRLSQCCSSVCFIYIQKWTKILSFLIITSLDINLIQLICLCLYILTLNHRLNRRTQASFTNKCVQILEPKFPGIGYHKMGQNLKELCSHSIIYFNVLVIMTWCGFLYQIIVASGLESNHHCFWSSTMLVKCIIERIICPVATRIWTLQVRIMYLQTINLLNQEYTPCFTVISSWVCYDFKEAIKKWASSFFFFLLSIDHFQKNLHS